MGERSALHGSAGSSPIPAGVLVLEAAPAGAPAAGRTLIPRLNRTADCLAGSCGSSLWFRALEPPKLQRIVKLTETLLVARLARPSAKSRRRDQAAGASCPGGTEHAWLQGVF